MVSKAILRARRSRKKEGPVGEMELWQVGVRLWEAGRRLGGLAVWKEPGCPHGAGETLGQLKVSLCQTKQSRTTPSPSLLCEETLGTPNLGTSWYSPGTSKLLTTCPKAHTTFTHSHILIHTLMLTHHTHAHTFTGSHTFTCIDKCSTTLPDACTNLHTLTHRVQEMLLL